MDTEFFGQNDNYQGLNEIIGSFHDHYILKC